MARTALGINAYHGDAAACLLRDGVPLAAAEEERFNRLKHWAGFPEQAIRYCLAEAGIGLDAVNVVAVNRDPRANLGKKIWYAITRRPSVRLLRDRVTNARAWSDLDGEFERAFGAAPAAPIQYVEHHLAHLASAYFMSPFEKAAVVSIDGFGDFASAAWGTGSGDGFEVAGRVYFPHSLGIFYQALTQYLGFPNYGDEYKVMGLAPYGRPTYTKPLQEVLITRDDGTFALDLDFFRHHREDLGYQWLNTVPTMDALYSERLVELLGPSRDPADSLEDRHRDIAHSVQAVYEDAVFQMLNSVFDGVGTSNLAIAGGCGANSVANGKLQLRTRFQNVYIPPATGDAGGAFGAAVIADRGLAGEGHPRYVMQRADWGPAYPDEEIEALLGEHSDALSAMGCAVERLPDLASMATRAADAIAAGDVVGWFRGRMEFGPRALGYRSIVCDPRRADMKQVLNLKIKRRESFRPFAPSIKREAVKDWFECDADVPFMSRVFTIRPEKRTAIPAVTHVDGSGRLQTVEREEQPDYYALIDAVERRTGVPLVLNTSFNENEPIVCRPEEALDCFLRTDMDALVIGGFHLARQREAETARPRSVEVG